MKNLLQKTTVMFFITFLFASAVALIVAPIQVSGPGVVGYDCGPNALCARGKNPHSLWFGNISLLQGDVKVGMSTIGSEYIMANEDDINESRRNSVLIGILVSLVTSAVCAFQQRKR